MSDKPPIIEADLTSEEVRKVNAFGENWIRDYDHTKRDHFKKALWLMAWDRRVIFADD